MILALSAGSATLVLAQKPTEPLTNNSIIKLVKAGFKDKTVIAIIHSRPNRFDLSPEHLIELKHNGVTENVILAMLSQDGSQFSTADDWNDDVFFGRKPADGRNDGEKKQDGTVDIFGSGGSSKGQTRGRGANNSTEGDTMTTGSATVRIVRPPVEEGGSPTKLERTPTLNNDSIIKLVEAGFSEGTIVKRIEESPAEFDLSPTKLADLRKHRVSDPIIAAMTAAMSDDAGSKPGAPAKSREN